MLNSVAGTATREMAIEQIDSNTSENWKAAAMQALQKVAATVERFTTDLVWEVLDGEPHDNRAMGPVMRRAWKAGLIEPTDQHELSERPQCHRRPMRVWQSLVYRG